MAHIQINHVSKRFGNTPVIQDVSLTIGDGEFCVLVGPSGSGKSTLLRLIAGLETVSEGELHIAGRDVTHAAPKDRDIAMVFQSYALYPQMTVRENMGFGLKLLKRPAEEVRRRVDEAAAMLDLQALMERRPAALSGGQRQRVAMGRAMVRQPAAFLFDEPLSNLDAALRTSVRAEIRAMHQRSKTTSVYVTHDQIEAMTMGDRIVVLRNGAVEQVGTPTELYDRPANRFVAHFIGSPAMNFIEPPATSEWLPAHMAASQNKVLLGVRPEHLRLSGETSGSAHTPARVDTVEFMGAYSQLALSSPLGPLVVSLPERPALRVGDNTQVVFDTTRLHFFDAVSGLRLDSRS